MAGVAIRAASANRQEGRIADMDVGVSRKRGLILAIKALLMSQWPPSAGCPLMYVGSSGSSAGSRRLGYPLKAVVGIARRREIRLSSAHKIRRQLIIRGDHAMRGRCRSFCV